MSEQTITDETPPDETDDEPDETTGPDEHDDDDDTPADEPEPEPEPPAQQDGPLSDEKTWDKLEQSAATWRRRVADLAGDDATELEPCPLCPDNLPGFIIPPLITEELKAEVETYLRGTDAPEMQFDPDAEVCDVCAGHGHTLTGSKVQGNTTKLCGKCAGNGWTMPEQRESWKMMHPPAQPAQAAVIPFTPAPATQTGMPATDMQGRPVGSEFYGRDPAYMTPEERQRDPWSPNV